MPASLTILKVGGSLLDVPGLGGHLARYLRDECGPHTMLVPGGGPTADAIRLLDRCQGLGEEKAHWLALRALSLNAHVLADLLPTGEVLEDVHIWRRVFEQDRVPVLDPLPFCQQDEGRPGALPHVWDVTSDSVAARVAVVAGAARLVLLKSAAPPAGDWAKVERQGLVDLYFARVICQPPLLHSVEAVNFRAWIASRGC
jgi:aspartokinase-like uncharacterized kinase